MIMVLFSFHLMYSSFAFGWDFFCVIFVEYLCNFSLIMTLLFLWLSYWFAFFLFFLYFLVVIWSCYRIQFFIRCLLLFWILLIALLCCRLILDNFPLLTSDWFWLSVVPLYFIRTSLLAVHMCDLFLWCALVAIWLFMTTFHIFGTLLSCFIVLYVLVFFCFATDVACHFLSFIIGVCCSSGCIS